MPPILDKTVFVSRLEKDGSDVDLEGYSSFLGFLDPSGVSTSAVKMNIQPANPEMSVMVDGVYGKVYNAFTTSSGVVEGMKLTVSGTGDVYKVRGRASHSNGILPAHYELVLIRSDR